MTTGRTYARLAVFPAAIDDQASRAVTFVLSDSSVARDGHVIQTSGWDLTNYKTNPVVLWAHEQDQPPVGKMISVRTSGDQLLGTVLFATADQNPFAESVYQLVKGGFLNAVSVSWDPIDWRYATAKGRAPGSIDFTKVDLLEVSIVPVPALPTALATARAAGIDTLPLGHWADMQLAKGKASMPQGQLEALRRAAAPARPSPATVAGRRFPSLHANLMAILDAARGAQPDDRLIRSFDRRLERGPSGLFEQDPNAGGFLVEESFIPDFVGLLYEESELANRCDRRTTSKSLADVKMPAIDESSRADGSRFGGALAYWLAEGGTLPASLPRLRRLDFGPHKLVGLIYGTAELHDDAPMFEAHIKRVFGAELGFKLDAAILSGGGAGLPLGILNSPALITIPKSTGQASGSIIADNINAMWRRLPAPSRKRAVWLVCEDAETQISQLPSGGETALWYNAAGMNGAPWPLLKGRPVIAIEQCPTLGNTGDIVLADLSQYTLIDGGMRTDLSADVMFISDQVVWRFVLRVDGKPIYATPVTPFNGGATRSPFVALAPR